MATLSGVSVAAWGCSGLIGSGVWVPATTSSPWALGSHSPKKILRPGLGSRVKHTPVALW